MKQIDSGALVGLDRALGLAGGGAQTASIDDGTVTQVLDIARIARRSRAYGREGGIFTLVFQNAHGAGTTTEGSEITPYAASVGTSNGFPSIVPDGFDIWLIGCSVYSIAGTAGNYVGGLLKMQSDTDGVAVDEAGAAVALVDVVQFLAYFDAVASPGATDEFGITEAGNPWVPINLRLPRGTTLAGASGTRLNYNTRATGAITTQLALTIALVPSSLGQDASS